MHLQKPTSRVPDLPWPIFRLPKLTGDATSVPLPHSHQIYHPCIPPGHFKYCYVPYVSPPAMAPEPVGGGEVGKGGGGPPKGGAVDGSCSVWCTERRVR